jgi:hypothetical protein
MAVNLKSLVGRRVRAKRQGWDDPPEGLWTPNGDLLDPPAWRDEGLPEDVEGVLVSLAGLFGDTVYFVDRAPVDPKTIRPVREAGDKP